MNNESLSQSCDNTVLDGEAFLPLAKSCPLCTGKWVSLGGLSKCMVCGFMLCESCGEGASNLESR